MNKERKPIDIILSLIPSLTPKEIDRVKKKLQMEQLTPCEKNGHSMKPIKTTQAWFAPPVVTMSCTKCGYKETV